MSRNPSLAPWAFASSQVAVDKIFPSSAPRDGDRADLLSQGRQEFLGTGHEGEMAGFRDQDQFLVRRRDLLEIIRGRFCGRDWIAEPV